MTNLFNCGDYTLHSGERSLFKINCDALTNTELNHLANLVDLARLVPPWRNAVGVPTGGVRFASYLRFMSRQDAESVLIVDDVLTTGASMEEMRAQIDGPTHGLVIFARGECPDWVTPIFRMTT